MVIKAEEVGNWKEGEVVALPNPPRPRTDFRKLSPLFICTAGCGEEEQCIRYKVHAMGCTFKGKSGTCEARGEGC